MDTNDYGNQSEFFQEASNAQAPPETIKPPHTNNPTSRKKLWIGVGAGVFFLMLLLALVLSSSQPATTSPTPIPTVTPRVTQPPSELERELRGIEEKVREADPAGTLLEPPPVDMKVEF
jgi:hypothetical protein